MGGNAENRKSDKFLIVTNWALFKLAKLKQINNSKMVKLCTIIFCFWIIFGIIHSEICPDGRKCESKPEFKETCIYFFGPACQFPCSTEGCFNATKKWVDCPIARCDPAPQTSTWIPIKSSTLAPNPSGKKATTIAWILLTLVGLGFGFAGSLFAGKIVLGRWRRRQYGSLDDESIPISTFSGGAER